LGRERLSWNSNFFYGNDSDKWCTDVHNYADVYYENLYDGIDLRYYTNEKGLKYDFIVHPGAAIEQIRLRYEGADELEIDNSGNLMVHTAIKDFTEGDLFCYQKIDSKIERIKSRFIVINKLEYGFELTQNYNINEELIVDPVLFSTILGGMYEDIGSAIAVDNYGNSYVTGSTESPDFPTTPGAFIEYSIYNWDAFVFKWNPYGSKLSYSTYIGGTGFDYGNDIVVDSFGNAVIIGETDSGNFPTTPYAYDTTINDLPGAWSDCFILKLNHNGSALIYSTFFGGYSVDYGTAIALEPNGNTIITGYTFPVGGSSPPIFPTTPGAYSRVNSGRYDVFVAKLGKDGSSLLYSTFIGGEEYDFSSDIKIDSDGDVYLTGNTNSESFPVTNGAYDSSYNDLGPFSDCFVLKLNLSNKGTSGLKYSSYIGGSDYDFGTAITLDSEKNIIITGTTKSTDFPITEDAYDISYNGDSGYPYWGDSFVLKLNTPYSELGFSTFIGGSNADYGKDISIDNQNNIIIAGFTYSLNFPTTIGSFDNECNNSDGFFCKLSGNGSELFYSSFLGGSENDSIEGMWYDKIGIMYLTGYTGSYDFPTTPNAFDYSYGFSDVFAFKMSIFPNFNFTSISLLENELPTKQIYTRLKPYTLRVNIINTISTSDLKEVKLILDPDGTNIHLSWTRSNGKFAELFDPKNYIALQDSSKFSNIDFWWTLDFNITFNWTYYNEKLFKLNLFASSKTKPSIWYNVTKRYYVENDLVLNGSLSVCDEDLHKLKENDLIRSGEELLWSGLRPVYENTTDVFPLDNEFGISIWNCNGNCWTTFPASGEFFQLKTFVHNNTNLEGDLHIINITGIPSTSDASNTSFSIRIDGDNVTFSNPTPNNQTWHIDETIPVAIRIMDHGGGMVDGNSIMYAISTNNEESYNGWVPAQTLNNEFTIEMDTVATFKNGKDNFIKWRALDSLGNGPVESQPYRILIDTEEVIFSNPWPAASYLSFGSNVEVGINISDNLSGVNGSHIEYSISVNDGLTWNDWISVNTVESSNNLSVRLNITLSPVLKKKP
jgi:hypothetical protein